MVFSELMAAGQAGDADAQFKLGSGYYYGNGTPIDREKAVEWWQKAAEQGHAGAQCSFGYCWYKGIVVEKDITKAIEWFQKAAEQGDADA